MKVVERIRDALIELDPSHTEVYRANTQKYLAELEELHRYVKAQAARVPSPRILITAHDAFYYFGRAYGFEVRGLQGVSTVGEAGAKDRRDLAHFIAQNRVPAIFVEDSVPDEGIQSVIETVKKDTGFQVRLGGKLYSDALGNPGTPAGTYIGMVRHNIDTIVQALAGGEW
jgi:manganese/zinc/iron transport system substrate-binding protein